MAAPIALAFWMLATAGASAPAAAQPVPDRGTDVIGPVAPAVYRDDVRALPLAPPRQPDGPVVEIPRRKTAPRTSVIAPDDHAVDPLWAPGRDALPDRADRVFTAPTLNVAGQGFTNAQPPDTVGDAGPNHFVQMVNAFGGSQVEIYGKAGARLAGPFILASLAAPGSFCRNNGRGDPIVLYDSMADRWLMSELAFQSVATGPFGLCVYVSRTSDPVAGGWFVYEFRTPVFPDYPKYGVWPDAYYVGTNEGVAGAYAMDRGRMLAGQPATAQRRTAPGLAGFGFQLLFPSDLDGVNGPPAGTPNFFVRQRDDEVHNPGANNPGFDFLEVWRFQVDFLQPANTSLAMIADVPVAEFDSHLCTVGSVSCIPQPGASTPRLDPVSEVIMHRLQYRNFGSHQTLVANFVTDVDATDRAGIRWFELRRIGAGPWTLHQEGTLSPDAEHRWMGTAAMDGAGNIALGYSVSSTATFPSMRYTGRLATDPLGVMSQLETTVFPGDSPNGSTRWGDYGSMSVDPADDCTFWFTHQYATGGAWSTRIAAFSFDACGSGTPPPTPLPPGTGGVVEHLPRIVDLNRDGRGDVLRYNASAGGMNLDVENGILPDRVLALVGSEPWSAGWTVKAADFDGDGRTDFFLYNVATGTWVKAINDGGLGFTYFSASWSPGWSVAVLELNGDGRSDVFLYNTTTGRWFRCTSLGAGTGEFGYVTGTWSPEWQVHPLDLDADGLTDLFLYNASGRWFRAINDGVSGFSYTTEIWSPGWVIDAGRFDADALADLFLYNPNTGQWFIARNTGAGFTYVTQHWSGGWSVHPANLNQDGLTDLFLYNPSTGRWFKCFSTGTLDFTYVTGGWDPGWIVTISEFDLDQRDDVLLYNPSSGSFVQALNTTAAGFVYAGGNWGPGWTVVGRRP